MKQFFSKKKNQIFFVDKKEHENCKTTHPKPSIPASQAKRTNNKKNGLMNKIKIFRIPHKSYSPIENLLLLSSCSVLVLCIQCGFFSITSFFHSPSCVRCGLLMLLPHILCVRIIPSRWLCCNNNNDDFFPRRVCMCRLALLLFRCEMRIAAFLYFSLALSFVSARERVLLELLYAELSVNTIIINILIFAVPKSNNNGSLYTQSIIIVVVVRVCVCVYWVWQTKAV